MNWKKKFIKQVDEKIDSLIVDKSFKSTSINNKTDFRKPLICVACCACVVIASLIVTINLPSNETSSMCESISDTSMIVPFESLSIIEQYPRINYENRTYYISSNYDPENNSFVGVKLDTVEVETFTDLINQISHKQTVEIYSSTLVSREISIFVKFPSSEFIYPYCILVNKASTIGELVSDYNLNETIDLINSNFSIESYNPYSYEAHSLDGINLPHLKSLLFSDSARENIYTNELDSNWQNVSKVVTINFKLPLLGITDEEGPLAPKIIFGVNSDYYVLKILNSNFAFRIGNNNILSLYNELKNLI